MYQSLERCQHCHNLQKGDRTECGNYWGISLLSAIGKIFARILLNRLSSHNTPEVVPETQYGFRSNRSTIYMLFCIRQFQPKCLEQDRPLYIVCVDFTRAFNTIGRTGLRHDRKSAYRNYGERQEWMGGLGYIFYNKRCQAGMCTGSHAFLFYLSVNNAWRGFQRHGGRSLHPITTWRAFTMDYSVGSTDETTCTSEIIWWIRNLDRLQECYGKMEWILSEIYQCCLGHRAWSAGKHTNTQCQYCPGWETNYGWDG